MSVLAQPCPGPGQRLRRTSMALARRPVPPARGWLVERPRPDLHDPWRVRAARRRLGLDLGDDRHDGPPRRGGEGHPAGAHAHGRRRLAHARAGRAPDPVAAHAERRPAADRRYGAHLRLRRPPGWLGRYVAARAGAHAGGGASGQARPAQSPDLGRLRQPGARRLDQHARRAARRGGASARGGRPGRRGADLPRHATRTASCRCWSARPGISPRSRGRTTSSSRPSPKASPADPLASMIGLVHAWRRFPWTDPDLPTELLPPHWRRPQAAAIFRRRHAQWSPAALAAWQQVAA